MLSEGGGPVACSNGVAVMADAALAELRAGAVTWHRARIAALRADPGMAALWAVIGEGAA